MHSRGISLVVALTFTGCSSPGTASPATSGKDAGATSTTGSLSCIQILECAAACPDKDTACSDACGNQGSTDGQAKAGALVDCANTNSCTDATCFQTKCRPSLDACVASPAPSTQGNPLSGTPPAGSVPADLVGTWMHSLYGFTESLGLGADGVAHWGINANVTQVDCYTEASDSAGNAVVTADAITIYATDVNNLRKPCGGATTKSTGSPIELDFTYTHPDADTLVVVDLKCANSLGRTQEQIDGDCTYHLTRQ